MAEGKETIEVYQDSYFTVTLQGIAGTNYSWCLTQMPEGITFMRSDIISGSRPRGWCGGTYDNVFYFMALKDGTYKLEFQNLCMTMPSQQPETETVSINVVVIPFNKDTAESDFVEYTENAAAYRKHNVLVAYGFPPPLDTDGDACCGPDSQIMKYGYPCGGDACSVVKYGFPTGQPVPMDKYGYPCGAADAQVVKYGYPC